MKNKGFTLIELVIVIMIIGTLVGIIIPTFVGQVNQAEIAATKANLDSIRSATRLYFSENNRHWPAKVQDLVDSSYLHIFPEEMITPAKTEKNSGGVDSNGGWYYEYKGDTMAPVITINKTGKDGNGKLFSEY